MNAADSVRGQPPAPLPNPSGPVGIDRDRDKVFDDLEARLTSGSPDDLLSVIVTLREPATAERVRKLGTDVGGFDVTHRFSIIDAFAARVARGKIRALAGKRTVDHVERNAIAHVANDSAQSSFGVAEARLDAPSVDGNLDGNLATYSRDDLVAAVIDTGIDEGHEDLNESKVIGFKDFVNNQTSAYDDEGHGTHVSATLAGEGDARADRLYKGVAPGAALVGVKVLDSRGDGSEADIIAGVDWTVTNKATYGIEVDNISLGLPGCWGNTDALSQAVNNARDAGLVMVVAAGNEGPGTCSANSGIRSPGSAAKALTVGAMADLASNGFYQADFSSRGPTLDGRIKPDVSAPGVNIRSAQQGTTTGYVDSDGTSMATPFTAGAALLMLDANPSLTPQQVKDKIMQTTIDWARGGDNRTAGSGGQDIDYGAGRLDAYAAINSAGAGIDSPPRVPAHQLREGTLSGTGAQVDYQLDITDTDFPIAATLIIPSISGATATNPDFDLFLFNPQGNEVDRGFTLSRQEFVSFKPTVTGRYTLRVRSDRGSGGFFVDISMTPKAPYSYPTGATPLRVPLVPAFNECTPPGNSTHGGGLPDERSCSNPQLASSTVTLGTATTPGTRVGQARMDVCLNAVAPGCTQLTASQVPDVRVRGNGSDVVCKAGAPPAACPGGAGSDYDPNPGAGPYLSNLDPGTNSNEQYPSTSATQAGIPCHPSPPNPPACAAGADMTAVAAIPFSSSTSPAMRVTDSWNSLPSSADAQNCGATTSCAATVRDQAFPVPVVCKSNGAGNGIGSYCGVNTTANALVPNVVAGGKVAVVEVGQIQVFDSGPNGTRANSDDQLFAVQGLMVP